jgi:hypothetical protein
MINASILMWMPVSLMVLGMMFWFMLLWGVKALNLKILLQGWFVCAAVALAFMLFKTATTQMVKPVTEVSPRITRPTSAEEVVIPVGLEDQTLKAKPRDVIDKQPATPLVDKALERLEK